MALELPQAERRPTLACIGRLDSVGTEVKESEKGYSHFPIKIQGLYGSRTHTVNLIFKPEWFGRDFHPKQIAENYEPEQASKLLLVYKRNIASKDQLGTVQALCGSAENFAALQDALDQEDLTDAQEVRDFLTRFFKALDVNVGYVLRQRRSKVGEDDEGKGIYELEANYDVGSWAYVSEKQVKNWLDREKRSQDKLSKAEAEGKSTDGIELFVVAFDAEKLGL